MRFDEQDWIETLDSLKFTEQRNPNGGMIIYDDRQIPLFQYDDDTKEHAFMFLSGAVYWKVHTELNAH